MHKTSNISPIRLFIENVIKNPEKVYGSTGHWKYKQGQCSKTDGHKVVRGLQ